MDTPALAVINPVFVVVPDTVRLPAIVGLFSIFAPVTASSAIFAVVTALEAILLTPVSYTHLRAHETR